MPWPGTAEACGAKPPIGQTGVRRRAIPVPFNRACAGTGPPTAITVEKGTHPSWTGAPSRMSRRTLRDTDWDTSAALSRPGHPARPDFGTKQGHTEECGAGQAPGEFPRTGTVACSRCEGSSRRCRLQSGQGPSSAEDLAFRCLPWPAKPSGSSATRRTLTAPGTFYLTPGAWSRSSQRAPSTLRRVSFNVRSWPENEPASREGACGDGMRMATSRSR
jgi:hypothetical protein